MWIVYDAFEVCSCTFSRVYVWSALSFALYETVSVCCIQVWVKAVGFPSDMRKIYPDSRIAGICSELSLPVPPKMTFIIGLFIDIHQNLALVATYFHTWLYRKNSHCVIRKSMFVLINGPNLFP